MERSNLNAWLAVSTNRLLTRSPNVHIENTLGDYLKKLDVPEKGDKRKLFNSLDPSIEAIEVDQTCEFMPEFSDSFLDIFLQRLDQEIARESIGEHNFSIVSAPSSTDDFPETGDCLTKASDQERFAKRSAHQKISSLAEEFCSPSSSNGYDSADESRNVDQSGYVGYKTNDGARTKINFLGRINRRSSVGSETDSISSIGSNISRYGRIRKPSSMYINATILDGTVKISAEIKQEASTLLNSHKCQNGSSEGFERSARYYRDQFNNLYEAHEKMLPPQFKKPANKITPSKNGLITRRFRKGIPLQLKNTTKQTTQSGAGTNLTKPHRSQSTASRRSTLIGDYQEQQNSNQFNFISPPRIKTVFPEYHQTAASINTKNIANCLTMKSPTYKFNKEFNGAPDISPPVGADIFTNPLVTNKFTSIRSCQNNETSRSQKVSTDKCGKKLDQNEIHAVVNNEVVSFKWCSPMPDLDLVLKNSANIHYSMADLKSFYTNVTVGYLKIDVLHKKPMAVLKNNIMLYIVEKGEGIFRVSGREAAGRIGSTFFIPLGAEYTITNLSTEEDLILKFIIMSPTI